jgi:hypothetical protein
MDSSMLSKLKNSATLNMAEALKIGEVVALTLGENPDLVAVVAAYLIHYAKYAKWRAEA